MGLGPSAVKLKLELWQRGYFKNIKSVAEIGSQEVHMQTSDFDQLVKSVGISNYQKDKFVNLANWPNHPRCPARNFYEMLGIEKYICVDINGDHGAIKLDLNYPLEDKSFYNQFDLVTDHGCNEHVFNVSEAYRTLHRLCKPGGLIIISQSVWGGNGYFLFDLSFFEGIAGANNYKILFSSYIVTLNKKASSGSENQFHIPLSRELLNSVNLSQMSEVGVCYVLQKQTADDFKYPYQGPSMSQMEGHEGFDLQFLPNPPSRSYVPVAFQTTRTKTLLKIVADRIIKKIKNKFNKFRF